MKKSKFRKAKYSGMSELKRMKELEKENRQLKQIYADLRSEYQALKDIVEKSYKTWRTP